MSEKMNSDFEAWAKSEGLPLDWLPNFGFYEATRTEQSWRAWQASQDTMKWISVFDIMPADGSQVLVFRPSAAFDQIAIRTYRRGEFSGSIPVLFWMPLPAAPEVEE